MFTYDEQRVIGSEGVALVNQISATQGTHNLIIKAFLLKLAPHHLLAHFRDAAIQRHSDAGLNAPIVAALV